MKKKNEARKKAKETNHGKHPPHEAKFSSLVDYQKPTHHTNNTAKKQRTHQKEKETQQKQRQKNKKRKKKKKKKKKKKEKEELPFPSPQFPFSVSRRSPRSHDPNLSHKII